MNCLRGLLHSSVSRERREVGGGGVVNLENVKTLENTCELEKELKKKRYYKRYLQQCLEQKLQFHIDSKRLLNMHDFACV